MSIISKKLFIPDKSSLVLILLIVSALAFTVTTFIYTGSYTANNIAIKKQITDIAAMSNSVIILKRTVEAKERKIKSSKTKGIVSELERTLKTLGMKASAIKPLDKKRIDNFTEENAELEMQETDLNSIVNLAYKIENAPAPMKINNAVIRTTFENPDKFMLKLTVSLLSK